MYGLIFLLRPAVSYISLTLLKPFDQDSSLWNPPHHSLLSGTLPPPTHPSNATLSHSNDLNLQNDPLHQKVVLNVFPHWYRELHEANIKYLQTEIDQIFGNLRAISCGLTFPNFQIIDDFKRGLSFLWGKAQEIWENGNVKGKAKPHDALVLGNGLGRHLTVPTRGCKRILCVDPSGKIRSEVKSTGLPLSMFEFVDVLDNIPFSDASFDGIVKKHPALSVSSYQEIAEANRLLRPRGFLIFVWTWRLRDYITPWRLNEGLKKLEHFSKDPEQRGTFPKAGFSGLEMHCVFLKPSFLWPPLLYGVAYK